MDSDGAQVQPTIGVILYLGGCHSTHHPSFQWALIVTHSSCSNIFLLIYWLYVPSFHEEIPPDIGQLHVLKNLSLTNNGFTGSVPSSIQNVGALEWLHLSSNYLTGLDRLLNLRVLDLHQNQLSGGVDHALKLFCNAVYVDLRGNSFLGSIPWRMTFGSVSSAFALEYLNLSRNQHSGPVMYSDDIPLFNSLNVLDLSHNHLSGELSGFRFVYALEVLNLGSNRFSGSLPNELLRQGSLFLTDLDLSANNLSGPLGMITSTTLRILNLSSNLVSGSVPSNLMKFPESSFYLGNSKLLFPCQTPSSYEATPIVVGFLGPQRKERSKTFTIGVLDPFISPIKDPAIGFKSQVTEVDIPMGVSPPRASEEENHGAFGDFSPNWLPGDLVCLDKTMFLTNEELSRAPAEVLGRSIHGTSYRAILDGGHSFTVKKSSRGKYQTYECCSYQGLLLGTRTA
ncbi:probable LRR receptor-like serine/threonine-protein kinase At4g20940 [Amborella trichopoda]|uniref:probable LRR receptor-like serine/threonine-protein kinase At4g20940 n=1 Tax=Amborella trichopoda TaxID=13333 RepID=UPI0009BED280|nr:probable LRR receptor-like serine/threonine-protein kinase At4g20940 [Amborella trichopoda]|eukprot:XP_020529343.1 probable LRR receptor-like serine/threonine-protein kinase At4g20940 [Amborella trichopoda]